MKRTLTSFAVAFAAMAAVPSPVAWADDPPPSKDDLAAAKKAFQEADVLYKAGKLPEAIEKLKESYRLSHNAFLLYNIGHAYDQIGQPDMVLMYYQKFLDSAPANAPMRPDVQKRVDAIQKEKAAAATEAPETNTTTPAPNAPTSKYSATDFKHTVIDTAPPEQPIDVTATVPADAGWTVTLNYRRSGEDTYTVKPMVVRGGTELVARINRPKVVGHSIQYYVEVKDSAGNVVTRAGKRLSPNLIYIEKNAQPHFDSSVTDPEDGAPPEVVPEQGPLRTDIFGPGGEQQTEEPKVPFVRAKWIATGSAVGLFAFSLTSYFMAGHEHELLRQDSVGCGTPPCRPFDDAYDHRIQTLGQRWDAIYKVTLVGGVVAAGVAGFFWYKNQSFKVAPAVDASYAGATAMGRF